MIEAFASAPELFDLYADLWGQPGEDLRVRHADSAVEFHVLVFDSPDTVARIATLGLASVQLDDKTHLGAELLMVIGKEELREIGSGRVAGFLTDIATHLVRHSVRPVEGSVIPRTSIAPWEPDAVVFDVPRGEPETLEHFVADGRSLRVVWAIPVYAEEAQLVQRDGIQALDALVDQSEFTLADIRRPNIAG